VKLTAEDYARTIATRPDEELPAAYREELVDNSRGCHGVEVAPRRLSAPAVQQRGRHSGLPPSPVAGAFQDCGLPIGAASHFADHPSHNTTGSLGYFANLGSVFDNSHSTKVEPRSDVINRAF
jgi:hypothetical protein